MSLHIHAPQPSEKRAARRTCPECNRRSVILSWFIEWYGWDSTCLRCGDSWADGYRRERPFMRGWRQKAIDAARKRWRGQ